MTAVADPERFIRDDFASALNQHARLHRNESTIDWLDRIMRAAVATHYYHALAEGVMVADLLWHQSQAGREPLTPWSGMLRSCVRQLLATLRPRYAELIARLDLVAERKADVAREFEISIGTTDVVLYRARRALHRRLKALCIASTRESCLAAMRATACDSREQPAPFADSADSIPSHDSKIPGPDSIIFRREPVIF